MIEIEDIKRIEVKPGDVFILKVKYSVTEEEQQELMRIWKTRFPNNKCLVVNNDMVEIDIVTEVDK